MHNVLILNYHSLDVGKRSAEYHVDPVYSVTQHDFEQQMALIKELKIPVVSLAEVVAHIHKRQRWHRHVVGCRAFYKSGVLRRVTRGAHRGGAEGGGRMTPTR